MIRSIVLVRVKEGVTAEQVEEAGHTLTSWAYPDRIGFLFAKDLQLKPDAMTFAVVSDFDDIEAYMRYDTDEEHNRIRAKVIRPLAADSARVVVEI